MAFNSNLIDITCIPETWIFEHYLMLQEPLEGQEIKIPSIFNPSERTPSFTLFVNEGRYFYKDFSSGKGGTALDLIKTMFNCSVEEAKAKIIIDFSLGTNDTEYRSMFVSQSNVRKNKYHVESYKTRGWEKQDVDYWWKQYGISSWILDKYEVVPLESFILAKEDGTTKIEFKRLRTYGYFNKGKLFKIYQPDYKQHKFILVDPNYVQGSNQLKGYDNLAFVSSLKDGMCLPSLNIKIDWEAPNSETTPLTKEHVEKRKKQYKNIIVIFDNDVAGRKWMDKYKEWWGLKTCVIPFAKDIADICKDYPESKQCIVEYINHALK